MVRTRQAKVDRIADSLPPLEVDDPSGRGQGAGARLGVDVRPDRRRLPPRSARPATTSPRPTCATSTRSRTTSATCSPRYDKVMVPEMNLGQLSMLLRASTSSTSSATTTSGLPLKAAELAEAIGELVAQAEGIEVDLTTDPARRRSVTDRPRSSRAAQRRGGRPDHRRSRRPARSSPATRRSAGAPAAATTPC